MSEQDSTHGYTKRRKSRQKSTENAAITPISPYPANDDKKAWIVYWKTQGQGWRTEPEIDSERQKYLAERRSIIPDIEKGIYPFKDIKLSRADVEWLLATQENKHESAYPNDWGRPGSEGLDLRGAVLRHVDLHLLPLTHLHGGLRYYDELRDANSEQRSMAAMHMEGANLRWAHLEGAYLYEAHLEGADLREANMEEAHCRAAHLEGANLRGVHLEGASLHEAHLEGCDLRGAFFSVGTSLRDIHLGNERFGFASLAGVRWNDADLAVVDWTPVKILGDEQRAQQRMSKNEGRKTATIRLDEYQMAVRANRKLAVALQGQGLNEEAARFAYRAQVLQRNLLWLQKKFGQYLFSLFLDLLAGYGYRALRSLVTYLVIIFGFMGLYLLNAHFVTPHLRWDEAFVLSVSSFHGRGFFSQDISLGDTYARLAAGEAVIGLLIEISLIVTFTQRFFAK